MDSKRLFSKRQRTILSLLSGGRCEICGARTKGEVDHVIPWSKGGRTEIENSQFLCPTCNRRKGAKVMAFPYQPRGWQASQVKQFVSRGMPGVWLTHAGTGTGKTVGTGFLIKEAIQLYDNPLIVVCSPLTEIKRSWEGVSEEFGWPADDDLTDLNSTNKKCLVLTYPGTADTAVMAIRKCHRPVILVLDEFHRIEEADEGEPASGWGRWTTELQSIAAVKHTFCLTATPWREGASSLPFIEYDEHNEVVADFKWGYADELQSESPGVVEVAFHDYDARCDYRKGDETGAHETESMDDYEPMRPRIPFGMTGFVRARKHKDLKERPVMIKMLNEATTELEVKRKAYGTIKGLVICESIETAKTVDDYIRNTLRRSCTLITSKQKGSKDLVDQFRTDTTEWCVSVGMLAEGVDVKTIKVVVDFSNILTLRDIIQRWGRALRVIPGVPTTASVYFIRHAMLVYVAERFKKDMRKAREDKREGEGGGDGGNQGQSKEFYNHDGEKKGAIMDGKDYALDSANLADWIISVQYHDIADYAHALIVAELITTGYRRNENPLPDGYAEGWETTEEVPSYSLRQQKKDQRSQAQEDVGKLAMHWHPGEPIGEACTSVNKFIKTSLLKKGYEHGTGEYNRARADLLQQYADELGTKPRKAG